MVTLSIASSPPKRTVRPSAIKSIDRVSLSLQSGKFVDGKAALGAELAVFYADDGHRARGLDMQGGGESRRTDDERLLIERVEDGGDFIAGQRLGLVRRLGPGLNRRIAAQAIGHVSG